MRTAKTKQMSIVIYANTNPPLSSMQAWQQLNQYYVAIINGILTKSGIYPLQNMQIDKHAQHGMYYNLDLIYNSCY